MKHLLRYTLLLLLALTAASAGARAWKVADIPNVQVTDSTQLVANPDNILSPAAVGEINSLLLDIRRKSTAEVVFVVIDSIDGASDIDTYGVDLFEHWGIGKKDKDNGVLVLVVPGQRRYTIKTGYGTEGILPTATLARMTRHGLEPLMRQGKTDEALVSTARSLNGLMTTEDAIAELQSAEHGPGRYRGDGDDGESMASLLFFVLMSAAVLTAVLGVVVLIKIRSLRGEDNHTKYEKMLTTCRIMGWMCVVTLGIGCLVYFPLKSRLDKWRNGRHRCPNCGHDMHKLDEDEDNKYLTPAQDTEEKLASVDYDVWLCDNCGETDILAYRNPDTVYTECPVCHSRACRMTRDRIIVSPTTRHGGRGVKEYMCMNCHKQSAIPYNIARLEEPSVVILPGGGGGFRGGGGFGGGGFGGGSTSGGGVSGGW